ncbi:hypothetical protein TetV_106 [Tetraselmis virus 1]|uniref:Uncharacterized protein n=1 Tax=Tetraselmis virus 1 TaxID=2060617 RepID=A0A2P0VMR4_9VIRU|nr:hypothetical protein QJ968_gp106 [Tetraselmis virus 1]AUF82198.1 hypothetical protein TetV_106 [Tetraselmis virus 1]
MASYLFFYAFGHSITSMAANATAKATVKTAVGATKAVCKAIPKYYYSCSLTSKAAYNLKKVRNMVLFPDLDEINQLRIKTNEYFKELYTLKSEKERMICYQLIREAHDILVVLENDIDYSFD